MNLTKYSVNRVLETFSHWDVPKAFADPMYNYLVHGYNPGSCFTSVLANDFHSVIARSHPANTVEAFQALCGWIVDTVPDQAFGSYDSVNDWCYLKDGERRSILEKRGLVLSKKDEVWMTLQDKPTVEPVLY